MGLLFCFFIFFFFFFLRVELYLFIPQLDPCNRTLCTRYINRSSSLDELTLWFNGSIAIIIIIITTIDDFFGKRASLSLLYYCRDNIFHPWKAISYKRVWRWKFFCPTGLLLSLSPPSVQPLRFIRNDDDEEGVSVSRPLCSPICGWASAYFSLDCI